VIGGCWAKGGADGARRASSYGRILGGEGPEHENRKSKSKIHNLLKYFDLPATHTQNLGSFLNQFNL